MDLPFLWDVDMDVEWIREDGAVIIAAKADRHEIVCKKKTAHVQSVITHQCYILGHGFGITVMLYFKVLFAINVNFMPSIASILEDVKKVVLCC